MQHLAYIMYVINGVSALAIAIFFYMQNNGLLRKVLIFYYLAFAQYQFTWATNFYMRDATIAIGTPYWYVANTPIVLANLSFFTYVICRGVCKR